MKRPRPLFILTFITFTGWTQSRITDKGGLLKIRMEFENQFDGGDVAVQV